MDDKKSTKEKIAADPYLIERKAPSETDRMLFLKEVQFVCPLCGKDLKNRKQRKNNKMYEIAHIFPNSPTEEQYEAFGALPRLGDNSESFENKIALCKDCHDRQDYHTTAEDYTILLHKKEWYLKNTALHDATISLALEEEIAGVVERISTLKEEEFSALNYNPVMLSNKFYDHEILIKSKISTYVTLFYPFIRDLFKDAEGKNGFCLDALSLQVKCCFVKMNAITPDKNMIFNHIADWVQQKTSSTSKEACEAVVSFFVQNCEVFYEITE